jgi:hypothetical protein
MSALSFFLSRDYTFDYTFSIIQISNIFYFESVFLEQVLDAHPYLHRLHCIKIRASFFSPLSNNFLFLYLSHHTIFELEILQITQT